MTALAEDTSFVPGTVLLGKYRLLRRLGVGGMSQVWCAEHVTLGTQVALKFLLPELATLPDAPQRFVREAKAAARVKSDHVAKVEDQGVLPDDGTPYMVMEYLEGKDLGRFVREGKRFPVAEAIDLVAQATDALVRAHAVGIIHRDVKPSNLFLTRRPDGSPLLKVLDFGISKVVEEAAKENLELTKTTVVMGSALYMSLEQMRSTKTVDHRTDVYALGVSLYELLTGTHPFTAESFSELCVKVSLDPPAPLRDHRPDVSEALADAIAVAYARSAAERYQTAGSFAAALLPFSEPDTARRIEAILQFERASYPDGKIPERQPTPLALRATDVERPPRRDWTFYALITGAILAIPAAFLVTRPPATGSSSGDAPLTADASTGVSPDAAATVLPVVLPVDPQDSGLSVAPLDGGATDGGKSKPPSRPCRPGENVPDPARPGMYKPCGL